MNEVFKNVVFTTSLLAMIAFFMTKFGIVRKFVVSPSSMLSLPFKLFMAIVFGSIGIMSTYLGFPVSGAIANTRVVGVLVGGLLGGPIVGVGAGLIAGIHRIAIDIGGFTAIACGVSTIVEGTIGGLLHKKFKQTNSQWGAACVIAVFAEIIQMGIILLIARPFEQAWELVKLISVPMVFINSVGTVIFIEILDSIFLEQDQQAARRIRMIMDVADKCLPYLSRGLDDTKSLHEAMKIIQKEIGVEGALITNTNRVLSGVGIFPAALLEEQYILPDIIKDTLSTGKVQVAEEANPDDPLFFVLSDHTALSAPLIYKDGEVVGTLTLVVRKYKLSIDVEQDIVGGLAKLFSTHLELSQIEHQKKMRKRAEFMALQSQVNPHFLFNSLSTITAFCREKPQRARELLIVLSTYFRKTLNQRDYMITLEEELEHVNAYLELEKARFEDKLLVVQNLPENLDMLVPSFVLQPLVENAVKHGATKAQGKGIVEIDIKDEDDYISISVTDNGEGIPEKVKQRLEEEKSQEDSYGMLNVHKRLRSIYGDDNGLKLDCIKGKNTVSMFIPKQKKEAYNEILSS